MIMVVDTDHSHDDSDSAFKLYGHLDVALSKLTCKFLIELICHSQRYTFVFHGVAVDSKSVLPEIWVLAVSRGEDDFS